MNLWGLMGQMGPVAVAVLLLLVALSVLSWTVIFAKVRLLRNAEDACGRFHDTFWRLSGLELVFERARRGSLDGPTARLFVAGYQELLSIRESARGAGRGLRGCDMTRFRSALRAAAATEMNRLQRAVPALATMGSTAPFIGLFGTVVGMIHALGQIGQQGVTHLAAVAPGIAEALIATAAGLFVAIPATVGYSVLYGRLVRLQGHIDGFVEDFIALVESDGVLDCGGSTPL
ncbi:MAG: MotA/TolQ/ExbB proton channel family protein [Myxococcota bacterium]